MTKFSNFIRNPGTAGPPTQEGIYALGFALRSEWPGVLAKYVRVDAVQTFTDPEKAQGRQNIGAVIGTDVQAFSASLTSLSGLTTAADRLAYTTASDTWAVTTLTAFARTILDDANAAAVRTTIGLGNVDNTSDADKPISTATQTALNAKASITGAETLTNKTLTTPVITRPLISGVVNASNAAAGDVGEVISNFLASGSAVPFTSSVSRNILSVVLTAGDWDCEGVVSTEPGGSTVTQAFFAGLSLVSATSASPSVDGYAAAQISAVSITGGRYILPTGKLRVNVSSPTTLWLVSTAVFSGGTLSGFGAMICRRVR